MGTGVGSSGEEWGDGGVYVCEWSVGVWNEHPVTRSLVVVKDQVSSGLPSVIYHRTVHGWVLPQKTNEDEGKSNQVFASQVDPLSRLVSGTLARMGHLYFSWEKPVRRDFRRRDPVSTNKQREMSRSTGTTFRQDPDRNLNVVVHHSSVNVEKRTRGNADCPPFTLEPDRTHPLSRSGTHTIFTGTWTKQVSGYDPNKFTVGGLCSGSVVS